MKHRSVLLMRVPGSVAPKRGDNEGKPLLPRGTCLSPACPMPVWGSGHSPGDRETSAHVPQGHVLRRVKTCPSALCLPLQALRSCQDFGKEIGAPPCASLSLSWAAAGGNSAGHQALPCAGRAVRSQGRAGVGQLSPQPGLFRGFTLQYGMSLSLLSSTGVSLYPAYTSGRTWRGMSNARTPSVAGDDVG